MKLSVAWIFDHIQSAQPNTMDALVDRFNASIAEIEGVERVTYTFDRYSLARVTAVSSESCTATSPEWNQDITLPVRPDAAEEQWFLVGRNGTTYSWADCSEFFSAKEGLMPAVCVPEKERSGGWKKSMPTHDIIFEVDNKSITHRPDMWSHRGFAREIAALLGVALKPLGEFVVSRGVAVAESAGKTGPFRVEVKDCQVGKRFAGLFVESVTPCASPLDSALRLLRVDARPIDAIVDATNYVMLDIGQPMHAFDAQKITTEHVVPRLARNNETITLLDGQDITLTAQDYVITDGKHPIALAGVMGGSTTMVESGTTRLFLESAHFDASAIRHATMRHSKRTESSARFEKTIDPMANVAAIERFLFLLSKWGVSYSAPDSILSLGTVFEPGVVSVTHDELERSLSMSLKSKTVSALLGAIGFGVTVESGVYRLEVPTFRAMKDVTIKQDVIEEVGRLVGYDHVTIVPPYRRAGAVDNRQVFTVRRIKDVLAFGNQMMEAQNYALYDNEFLAQLGLEPTDAPELANPVSESHTRLVTSLIPHLIKSVKTNIPEQESVRLFEWAEVFKHVGQRVQEHPSLAGIVYHKDRVDFYDGKQVLQSLFAALDLDVIFEPACKHTISWFEPHRTARLVTVDGIELGYAGILSPVCAHTVFSGQAFIFELDGQKLCENACAVEHAFEPLSKFPKMWFDISTLVPHTVLVDQLMSAIAAVDPRISDVSLRDIFFKPEWDHKKSITLRYSIQDRQKTLTAQEADELAVAVQKMMERLGGECR